MVWYDVRTLEAIYRRLVASKRDIFTDEERPIPVGWDGRSRQTFEKQLDQHLRAASRQIASGRYQFRPFAYVEIEKPDGDTRKIAMASIRDRIVQQAVYDEFYECVEPALLPCAHAYRVGRSPHSAISAVRSALRDGREYLLKSDFVKFFDRLDHDLLMERVSSLVEDPLLVHLIWRYIRTPEMPKSGPRHPIIGSRQQGVPQGGVLSGLLSNLYVTSFDKELMGHGYYLVRYADDFVILCKSEKERSFAKVQATKAADQIKLELHPDKTDEVEAQDGIDFVGFRVTANHVSVRDWNVKNFKQRILDTIQDEKYIPNSKLHRRPIKRLINHLNSKIYGGVPKDGGPRRSWLAFFRIVDDIDQLTRLNRWLWQEFSNWHFEHYGTRLSHKQVRELGLRSLVTEYWRVRREFSSKSKKA